MKASYLKKLIKECINEVLIERGGDLHERSGLALTTACSIWENVYHVECYIKDNKQIQYKVLVEGPKCYIGYIKQSLDESWSVFNYKSNKWKPISEAINEISTSQGGAGGEGYLTKYAFSRRDIGNSEAAETLGYTIVNKNKKEK